MDTWNQIQFLDKSQKYWIEGDDNVKAFVYLTLAKEEIARDLSFCTSFRSIPPKLSKLDIFQISPLPTFVVVILKRKNVIC